MEITADIWDFIEENLPGYYHRDDVLRHSSLQLLADGEPSCITSLSLAEAKAELKELTLNFCLESITAYMQARK